jgi:2-oxoglutarate ferredoxin oxidoreductase subunit alpha
MARELWKGNEAIAEAAIRGGVEAFFGYPITPQTELLEYMAARMPELGRVFLQAESEVAAVNMVYGAACGGARAMSSSSGPGISLMQEGLSYIAGSEVPAVFVDVMRGGPGLGNIQPSQADYFQVTRSAGHGDFHPIVLAPSTVQEAVDLTYEAFPLAERYRTIVILATDGSLGQMMEPAEMPPARPLPGEAPSGRLPWAVRGAAGQKTSSHPFSSTKTTWRSSTSDFRPSSDRSRRTKDGGKKSKPPMLSYSWWPGALSGVPAKP